MSSQDPFSGISQPNFPPRRGVTLVPTDGAVLTNFVRKIWVGATGNIRVTMAGDGPSGTPITLTAVPVGMLDIQACIIWSTGTTGQSAGTLIGFFD